MVNSTLYDLWNSHIQAEIFIERNYFYRLNIHENLNIILMKVILFSFLHDLSENLKIKYRVKDCNI